MAQEKQRISGKYRADTRAPVPANRRGAVQVGNHQVHHTAGGRLAEAASRRPAVMLDVEAAPLELLQLRACRLGVRFDEQDAAAAVVRGGHASETIIGSRTRINTDDTLASTASEVKAGTIRAI